MADPRSASHLVEVARYAAGQAAQLVRDRRRDGVTVTGTKSSEIDIVTETDRESESLIRELIEAARPDDDFLGEEGVATGSATGSSGSSGVRWVVDPIDGTVNYLYGLPQYAVSIAAERDGVVVAGVVVDVASGTEYAGERHPSGEVTSLRDGCAIAVRDPAPLAQRLIATGFSYEKDVRALQAAATARLLPHIRDIRRLGSCALDLCHVAEGQARRLRRGGGPALGPCRRSADRRGGRGSRRAGSRSGRPAAGPVRSRARVRHPAGGGPGRRVSGRIPPRTPGIGAP